MNTFLGTGGRCGRKEDRKFAESMRSGSRNQAQPQKKRVVTFRQCPLSNVTNEDVVYVSN
jgi:hypothetical protein